MSHPLKSCPVCHCENPAADFFCQHCGMDISQVRPAVKIAPAAAPPPAVRERTCPHCGQNSDAILPLCTHCGFELNRPPPAQLQIVIGGENYVAQDGDVLGREGTLARSFLRRIGTVSRRHVTFSYQEGRWFITVAAQVPNITQLDGVELPRDRAHPLTGAHTLKLSTQCEAQLRILPG